MTECRTLPVMQPFHRPRALSEHEILLRLAQGCLRVQGGQGGMPPFFPATYELVIRIAVFSFQGWHPDPPLKNMMVLILPKLH